MTCRQLSDDSRGKWREENAVAEVTGRREISQIAGFADHRQAVRTSWTQACPSLEDSSFAQFRHKNGSGLMHSLNGPWLHMFIEAGFFDGGSDDDPAVAARDEVAALASHDVTKREASAMLRDYREHLPLNRAGLECAGCNPGSPRAGAIDRHTSWISRFFGFNRRDFSGLGLDRNHLRSRGDVGLAVVKGLGERFDEAARVKACFGQEMSWSLRYKARLLAG